LPVISQSSYRAPALFSNCHLQTVFPSLLRRVSGVTYSRTRIDTPDGDFLDLDVSSIGSERVAVVLHGLEGDSTRAYILGMVKALNKRGWDATALNFRGCSGECNRKVRFYHSGDTADLRTVISHLLNQGKYSEMALVGFSLGGNVVLKYLGEQGNNVPSIVRKAAAISVPCDLPSSSVKLAQSANRLYLKRFLRMLRKKIRMKMAVMPGLISDHGYGSIKSFKEFDDRYTAPMHGFRNAEDYWEKASSKPFLRRISVPTLLISAADDPFLTEECFPVEEANENPFLFLEIPDQGGHVGFVTFNRNGEYWSESRVVSFLNDRR